MSNVDLDIEDYSYEDLLKVFNVSIDSDISVIKNKYQDKLSGLVRVEDDMMRKHLQFFFAQAYNKILEKVLEKEKHKHEYQALLERDKKLNITPNPVLNIKYPAGVVNPIERKTVHQLLSINSQFRDLTKYPRSTDFVINIPSRIDNVIGIKTMSVELPNTIPVFSNKLRNNQFKIKITRGGANYWTDGSNSWLHYIAGVGDLSGVIINIPEGVAGIGALISTINAILDSQRNSYSFLKCSFDNYDGKIVFRFKTINECAMWNKNYALKTTNPSPDIYAAADAKLRTNWAMPNGDVLGKYVTDASATDLSHNYVLSSSFLQGSENKSKSLLELYHILGKINYRIDFNPQKVDIIKSFGWLIGYRPPFEKTGYNTASVSDCKKSLSCADVKKMTRNRYFNDTRRFGGSDKPPSCYETPCDPSYNKVAGQIAGVNESGMWVQNPERNIDGSYNLLCNYDGTILTDISMSHTYSRDGFSHYGYFKLTTPYVDFQNSAVFLYVDDFVGNYEDNFSILTDNAYISRSILAKLQLSQLYAQMETKTSSQLHSEMLEKQREYFGPVTIKKLHIKLLDKYGEPLNLDNSNFSLVLQFEKLYSNVRQ